MRIPLHFFGDGGYVRVPGEVLVEHNAEVSHTGALTDRILAKPNCDGGHVSTILERTAD